MIRKMEKRDILEIVADEERIFGSSLGEAMLHNELSNPMAHYFVMEENNVIISYIGLWEDSKNAQILNFYVKEKFRRLGYAKKMLEYALNYLDNLGVEVITLEVRPSNLNAIDLYEKYKFEYSYKRRFYYNDGEDALVLIRRKDWL